MGNIETIELASLLEKHELVEFRRIASYLYKNNKKWHKSIELSKKDSCWKDAIETAAASKRSEVVEELLRFFVSQDRKDCFAACLYNCFDHVAPDVVLELGWRNGMTDFAMPFFIQTMKNMNSRLQELEKRVLPSDDQNQVQVEQQPMGMNPVMNAPPGMNPAAMNPAAMNPAAMNPGMASFQ